MNLKEERNNYIEKFKNATDKEKADKTYSFALFSANLKRFVPNLDKDEYIKYFEGFLYSKWMSGLEQYSMEYLQKTKIINHSSINLCDCNQSQSLIFASFHFGSFRLFNSYLYELGHKIVIIIDDNIVQQQKDDLLYKVKPLLNGTKDSDFLILSVQDRSSIFKLKKLISEGYIMTVYLDGNMGINMKSQDFEKGFIPIDFLNQKIFVKNGIAKLAVLLNAKIVPTISYRTADEDSTIEFSKELSINNYSSKDEFIINSIQDSYKLLEKKIIEYPTQWTCWITLQNLFLRNYSTPFIKHLVKLNQFNNERYTFFTVKDSYFIFDLLDYKSYPIDNVTAKAIQSNNFKKIDKRLVEELLQKNIII